MVPGLSELRPEGRWWTVPRSRTHSAPTVGVVEGPVVTLRSHREETRSSSAASDGNGAGVCRTPSSASKWSPGKMRGRPDTQAIRRPLEPARQDGHHSCRPGIVQFRSGPGTNQTPLGAQTPQRPPDTPYRAGIEPSSRSFSPFRTARRLVHRRGRCAPAAGARPDRWLVRKRFTCPRVLVSRHCGKGQRAAPETVGNGMRGSWWWP